MRTGKTLLACETTVRGGTPVAHPGGSYIPDLGHCLSTSPVLYVPCCRYLRFAATLTIYFEASSFLLTANLRHLVVLAAFRAVSSGTH